MRQILVILLIGVVALSACDQNDDPIVIPTPANPEAIQTAIILTENAPPTQFATIGVNPITFNRDSLPGWRSKITVNFEGQYTDTTQNTTGTMVMEVWENSVLRIRRVVLNFLGDALSSQMGEREEGLRFEAVRVENDYYLLDAAGICTQNSEAAIEIANLDAERVTGGVTFAQPRGVKDTINGYDSFQYGFLGENVVLNIFREQPSAVDVVGGELWFIPEFEVVGRYAAVFNVHNAKILFSDQPVTGQLRFQYDLMELAELPNLSIPNGC